uniref:Uncharacterized protein n=1 Tax=Steinernema glaseri TaxID=37863 RepID=A0A1I7ZZC4_9BILA
MRLNGGESSDARNTRKEIVRMMVRSSPGHFIETHYQRFCIQKGGQMAVGRADAGRDVSAFRLTVLTKKKQIVSRRRFGTSRLEVSHRFMVPQQPGSNVAVGEKDVD